MEINDIAFILFPGIIVSMEFVIGSLLGENKMVWYNKLKKPPLIPPNWVFFPMWTFLYVCIGLAGYIVWEKHKGFSELHKEAWVSFFIQLTLNYMFTPLFFRLHWLKTATLHIIITVIAIIWNATIFTNIDVIAGWLLLPYVLWTSFAMYLTIGILILNPEASDKSYIPVAPGEPSIKDSKSQNDEDVSKISSLQYDSDEDYSYSFSKRKENAKKKN